MFGEQISAANQRSVVRLVAVEGWQWFVRYIYFNREAVIVLLAAYNCLNFSFG